MKQREYAIKERLLAWVLTLALVFGFVPAQVFATDTNPDGVSVSVSGTTSVAQGTDNTTLTASATTESDHTAGTWQWSFVSGSSNATLTNGTSASATVTANSDAFADGNDSFTVSVKATYTYGSTYTVESDTKTITFIPAEEEVTAVQPYISDLNTSSSVAYIGEDNVIVSVSGTNLATSYGTTYAWSISAGSDYAEIVGSTTGNTVTIKGTNVGSVTVKLVVTNGNLSAEKTKNISVQEPIVPEKPVITPIADQTLTMVTGPTKSVTLAATLSGTPVTDGTWDLTSNDLGVVTVDSYGKLTAVSAGTAMITVNFKDTSGTVAEPDIFYVTVAAAPDPTLEADGSQNVTITWGTQTSTTLKVKLSNAGDGEESNITWTYAGTCIAEVTGSGTTKTIYAVSEGTATVTAKYGTKSVVFTITVMGSSSGGDSDSTTPEVEEVVYVPTLNWYGDSGDIVLASVGKTAQRKVSVAVTVDSGYATSAEISAEQSRLQGLVVWEPIGSADNVVNVTNISYGKQFTYLKAGQVSFRVFIDLDGDGVLDTNEQGNCFTFSVTNTGLVVSDQSVNLTTFETSSTIYVYSYGDVGTISASSQNTTLATVATTTGSSANNEAMQLTISTKGEVGSTVILLEYSGGSESIAVTIADSVAGNVYPTQTVNVNNPLWFRDIIELVDAEAKKVYAGESIVSMQSIEVGTSVGMLYIGYQNAEYTGGAIGTSINYYVDGTPSLNNIVFVPKATYTGSTAVISYTGFTSSGRSFYGEIHVIIGEDRDITMTTKAQTPITLEPSDFSNMAQSMMSQNLSNVVFTLPEENKAVLYYDYTSADNYHHKLAQGEVITLANIDKVTIIPSPGFGTPAQDPDKNLSYLEIPYIATGSNGTIINQVFILQVSPYEDHGPVVYNTRMGEYVTLISSDFHTNSRNNSKDDLFLGYDMSYITFTLPDETKGVLYEDYRSEYDYRGLVTAGTPYYATARDPQISQVSFVPARGFTGVVNIDFVGYNTVGGSYAGTLQINVTTNVSQDINYICTSGGYVSLYEEDFNQFSRNTVGNNVDYITFTSMPESYQGSLRLGQSPTYDGIYAENGMKYYRTASPYISALTFQSVAGFTGVVEIAFEGMSTTGQAFAGTVSITVTNQNVVQIPYSATRFSPAEVKLVDFEHYAMERTGSSLDYVRFILPDAEVGVLYYDYDSSDDYHGRVSADENYYASKSLYLEEVSFLPTSDFVGTTYVDFTGFGTNGQQFVGRMMILVAESGDPLHYQIHSGEYMYLSASAINSFCQAETGSTLNYISLELPSSRQGVLYQNYLASNLTHTGVSNSTRYYFSKENYINDIAFVSASQYVGTVEIPFNAIAEDGSSCSGILTIVVLPMEAEGTIHYYTSFSPIVFKSQDISDMWNGATIDYIQLHNLPASSAGKLYYENNLSSFATLDTYYYGYMPERGRSIDSMIFVPSAAYNGTVTIAYTATTLAGSEFTGEIKIVITPQTVSQYFTDLTSYTWAVSSADYLYTTGVTVGVGNSQFGASRSITRGDYALMIQKAFRFGDVAGTEFSDVSTDAYYSNAVRTLRYYGILSGDDNNKFYPNDSISRQDAMIMLYAAMVQANKSLPSANINVLYNYADVTSVYTYAADQLSIMVQAGVVAGDSAGKLNPQAIMTRAEMAVVMHKAMTY